MKIRILTILIAFTSFGLFANTDSLLNFLNVLETNEEVLDWSLRFMISPSQKERIWGNIDIPYDISEKRLDDISNAIWSFGSSKEMYVNLRKSIAINVENASQLYNDPVKRALLELDDYKDELQCDVNNRNGTSYYSFSQFSGSEWLKETASEIVDYLEENNFVVNKIPKASSNDIFHKFDLIKSDLLDYLDNRLPESIGQNWMIKAFVNQDKIQIRLDAPVPINMSIDQKGIEQDISNIEKSANFGLIDIESYFYKPVTMTSYELNEIIVEEIGMRLNSQISYYTDNQALFGLPSQLSIEEINQEVEDLIIMFKHRGINLEYKDEPFDRSGFYW